MSIFESSLPTVWLRYNNPDIDLYDDITLDYHLKMCRFVDKNTIQELLYKLIIFKQSYDVDPLLSSYFESFYKGLLDGS